ncbi:aminotransferase class IV, partial [bacterium]|nr:aminotransferase class IV [bacterium]
GNVKAGLNYAMSLHPYTLAHKNGFDENVYLDSATRTKIEETGGANIIFVSKDKKLVVPKSDSILPSITRRSLVDVAKNYLNLEVEERDVLLTELSNFVECGLCGTAAVVSPVGSITDKSEKFVFANSANDDSIVNTLRKTLTGMQWGEIEAPQGWIRRIK